MRLNKPNQGKSKGVLFVAPELWELGNLKSLLGWIIGDNKAPAEETSERCNEIISLPQNNQKCRLSSQSKRNNGKESGTDKWNANHPLCSERKWRRAKTWKEAAFSYHKQAGFVPILFTIVGSLENNWEQTQKGNRQAQRHRHTQVFSLGLILPQASTKTDESFPLTDATQQPTAQQLQQSDWLQWD